MDTAERKARRWALKPLARRKAGTAAYTRLERALEEFQQRGIAAALLPGLAEREKAARKAVQPGRWKEPEAAKAWIEFGLVMYIARRISLQEYVFMASSAAENVHEERMQHSAYPEIEELTSQLRATEVAHGLEPDEYWPAGSGPVEYQALSREYDEADRKRFSEVLAELEGGIAAQLLSSDQAEFDRLRERGRRSFFHQHDELAVLSDTIVRYEMEALVAASARAFTAAVTLLGSAVEGLLLLRCLRSSKKATRVAQGLPRAKRPPAKAQPSEWSFDVLINVCLEAGWLPKVTVESTSVYPGGLAHLLRRMRNLIHPGKVCRDKAWIEAEQRDFEDAHAIYTTLFATLSRGAHMRRLQKAAEVIFGEPHGVSEGP